MYDKTILSTIIHTLTNGQFDVSLYISYEKVYHCEGHLVRETSDRNGRYDLRDQIVTGFSVFPHICAMDR